jgi:GcrA cell cycle regulator
MVARTWTDQRLADLTYWWATKLSSVEIGLKMGITKNAVIGAARRLKLPSRGSPIIRNGGPRPHPQPKRAPKATLQEPVADVPPPPPPPPVVHYFEAPTKPCRWPMWGNERSGGINARFCCAPSMPGRPLLPSHHARAYVVVRRAEAAADSGRCCLVHPHPFPRSAGIAVPDRPFVRSQRPSHLRCTPLGCVSNSKMGQKSHVDQETDNPRVGYVSWPL